MNILKKNTIAKFQIVPRIDIDISKSFKIDLKNEMSQKTQSIVCSVESLPNENNAITLVSFPTGKIGDKFSYSIIQVDNNEIVSLGKLIILSETENVQDYSKKSNNKFYK